MQCARVWYATHSTWHVASRIALLQLAAIPFATHARGCVWHDVAIDPDDRVAHRHGENRGMEFHPADLDCVRFRRGAQTGQQEQPGDHLLVREAAPSWRSEERRVGKECR